MKYQSGFQGHDSMREKAERMFRQHLDDSDKVVGAPLKYKGPINHYKKGGHVASAKKRHPLTKEQTDLHIPRHVRVTEKMRHGGHCKTRKYNLGGDMPMVSRGPFSEMPVGINPLARMKKGGAAKRKHHYANGGDVYEHMMAGEHPTRSAHHYNYESLMRGEHPVSRPRQTHVSMEGRDDESFGQQKKRGGHVKRMAMGGPGKMRKDEMTHKGLPVRHRRNLGR